jgi:flagellar hook-associated protein 3 FlgL
VSSIGELRDLDYAEAISRMNQQLTSLQAAQAAYTRIAQLSLFDYL